MTANPTPCTCVHFPPAITASSALIQLDHSQQVFEWLIAVFRAIDRLRQQGDDPGVASDIARLTALGSWISCQGSDTLGDARQGVAACFEAANLLPEGQS